MTVCTGTNRDDLLKGASASQGPGKEPHRAHPPGTSTGRTAGELRQNGRGVKVSNAVFIRAEELAQELEISKAKAYKMIRQWNDELRAKGYATVNGRVSRQYYLEHIYGMNEKKEV